jgi:hypothetical protein
MARRTCFVISPIGDPGSSVRKRADQVFKHIIKPVTLELKYRAKRADHMKRPGIITSQVLTAVADSDLVVADLTDHNPNVFYELAIRHAAQRPVVQLIDAAQELPFDVANMRTIYVDIHDLDSTEDARKELKEHVQAAEADSSPVETPVVAAKSMRSLWDSKEPTDTFIVEALDELRALKQERLRMDRRAIRAEAVRSAVGEVTLSSVTPNISPITAPKPIVITGQPSTLDVGAGLFDATNEPDTADDRNSKPTQRTRSRKSRKRDGDESHRDE